MAKRFLSRELIITTAFNMIDEKGTDSFSIRQLAEKLDVRVSSLYNHIENEYDLLLEVSKKAADMYADFIAGMVKGLDPEAAAYKGGEGFRIFVNKHKYLYELLLDRRWIGDPKFMEVKKNFTKPIDFLTFEGIEDKSSLEHIYIAMRVVTHGFASLETLGVFDGLSIDANETYKMLMKNVIDMMENFKKKE